MTNRRGQALVAAGHDVIEWIPLNHQEGWDLIVRDHLDPLGIKP